MSVDLLGSAINSCNTRRPATLNDQSPAYMLDQMHDTANSCCCHKSHSASTELAQSEPPKHPPNHLPSDMLPAKSKSTYIALHHITRDRLHMMTKF